MTKLTVPRGFSVTGAGPNVPNVRGNEQPFEVRQVHPSTRDEMGRLGKIEEASASLRHKMRCVGQSVCELANVRWVETELSGGEI